MVGLERDFTCERIFYPAVIERETFPGRICFAAKPWRAGARNSAATVAKDDKRSVPEGEGS